MGGERGQASILIAVIFQILFVFFAMVINVGLLVHDKINLQNSTDIAAYYAAMKQAEVLNTMAQLNYQIHQTWKLFNWRLWVLADAGRNQALPASGNTLASGIPTSDSDPHWVDGPSYPVVCVANQLWKDRDSTKENLCAKTSLNLQNLVPPNLIGAQGVFAQVFQVFINGISAQNDFFKGDFKSTGLANYKMTTLFLSSFKIAAARRRFAIHNLQNLLIASANDFKDLSGSLVKATTQLTLFNNLTASNKANGGPDFEFQNGLGNNPFMVPIEVRAFVNFLDFDSNPASTQAYIKPINLPSVQDSGQVLWQEAQPFWFSDYDGDTTLERAADFVNESEDFASNNKALKSLIGFEKNPWVLAYVRVKATTHPKMLFSPVSGNSSSGISLTAESYAMPFGGKMGPWYYDSWPSGQETSRPGNLISQTKYAAPRMDTKQSTPTSYPNYSRFPGDQFGLASQLPRYVGLSQIYGKGPNYSDYDFTSQYSITDPKVDPIVATLPNASATPPLRPAEIAAVAPDLFDAAYYSVTYDFPDRYKMAYGGSSAGAAVLTTFSNFDLGNDVSLLFKNQGAPLPISQIFFSGNSPSFQPNPQIWTVTPPFWILTQPQHLNTSWSQGDPGEYDGDQAALSVGQTWNNSGGGARPAGGRAGYSVKIVSKHFLQRTDLPFGGVGVVGGITNPPQ